MNTLARCCLITLRFESDAGHSLALCSCCSTESFSKVVAEAFPHPLFSRFDDASKTLLVAQSLERHLLLEAGVASQGPRTTEEAFFLPDQEAPIVSQWLDLPLAGKINPRKARMLESTLREWTLCMFSTGACCLPSARPIPFGSAADLGALRAGWRAEAEARGFAALTPAPGPAPANSESSDPSDPVDGFPSGTRARRKK